jgi:hypothetical protein
MATPDFSTFLVGCGTLAIFVLVIRRVGAALGSSGADEQPQRASSTPLPNRSFYCLELSYDFDGARASTELYVYRSLDFVRQCVAQRLLRRGVPDIEHLLNLFSRTGGRASACVRVFIGGRQTASASLLNHLQVRAGDEVLHLAMDRTPEESARLSKRVDLELDWAAVVASLPALTGDLLHPGEAAELVLPAELRALWRDEDEPAVVQYGFQDLHFPDSPATEPLDDPDPVP